MRDLVTLIGYVVPDTGAFAYRAVTPQGEYTVQDLGGYWGAVLRPDDFSSAGVTFGFTPEDAVRKALAQRAIAA